jgi:tetratricopeptide (TPR) repeat protein
MVRGTAAVIAATLAAWPLAAARSEVTTVPSVGSSDARPVAPAGGDHDEYSLDTLFSALRIAPDDASAKAIEDRIWSVWTASGSDTCNLLMSREKAATDAKEYDIAIRLLDSVIALKPDYVEAWNRRATIYYLKQDYPHALADIAEVLAREPRHFGALSGLGLMLQEIGDDKDALEAYRKALAIDPHLENVPETVRTLTDKVEGRDI